jgi:acyl-coenzyme A synthetase/AMP-(fatty) acid ligase
VFDPLLLLLLLLLSTPGEGILAIKSPWPCMMRTVYGDHERFQQTYFSAFKGYYFTGGLAWLCVV